MPFIPEQQLEEIRSRADIVQVVGERVRLKPAGRNLKGLCPFHSEKTPSFTVHPEKQIYHCFGCSAGGDVFSFLMKFEGIEFGEAIERLADRYGITLTPIGGQEGAAGTLKQEKDLLYRVNRLALRFFYDTLQGSAGTKGAAYLEKREVRGEMIREAYLGYAPADGRALVAHLREKKAPLEIAEKLGLIRRRQPQRGVEGEAPSGFARGGGDASPYYDFFRDRLMFAIVSPEEKILGFSGRALDDTAQPKYLNSPETPIYHKSETLLGIHLAKQAIREADQVILVEGNFDMLRLQQEGIRNVVAPLGTALTERQVRYLKRFTENFVLIFDGDEAGVRASERALEIFLPMGLGPRVALLPAAEDPDSFVRKEGADALRQMVSVAASLLDVRIEHILQREAKDAQGRVKAVKKIAEILLKLPGEIEKGVYIQKVAAHFGLAEEALKAELSPKRRGARMESNFSAPRVDQAGRDFPPIERTVLEVLLSGQTNPGLLFREIEAIDFSHPALGEIWGLMKEGYAKDGRVDLAKILGRISEEGAKKTLTALAVAGNRWTEEDGGKVVADCLRQLRTARFRGRLQDLSQEIRKAETEHDLARMKDLLDEKNRLIKEMTSLH